MSTLAIKTSLLLSTISRCITDQQFNWFMVLGFISIQTIIRISCTNECRSVTSIDRYTLKGHAYKTVKDKDVITCVVTCDHDPACYSINYIFSTGTCELCHTTRVSHPSDLIYTPDSVYMEHLSRPAGSCSGNMPCRNRGTCVNVPQSPGYRCFCRDHYVGDLCEECSSPHVGLSDNRLPNDKITGTSNGQWMITFFYPYMARLKGSSAWVSSLLDTSPFLEINVGPRSRMITKIATQGSPEYDWWTTSYSVKYSLNRVSWTDYTDNDTGQPKVFRGNSDRNTIVQHTFKPAFVARYLIVSLLGKHTRSAIRLEFYGCYAE
ncbi:lactadherin-like isoform X2 [Actinia tenebrosa]|nr:lactadherin-like isoform X2 [Actinia tenebrosa]XP_031556669.1 lactadherin-like isoform X2 [Actinia tenebrosa]